MIPAVGTMPGSFEAEFVDDYCSDTVGCFSHDYGSSVVASRATSGLRVLPCHHDAYLLLCIAPASIAFSG